MSLFPSILAARLRSGPCLSAVAATIFLAVCGCTRLDLRGERFPDDPMSDLAQRMRHVDEQAQSFAFSNKARQIDQDLGVR